MRPPIHFTGIRAYLIIVCCLIIKFGHAQTPTDGDFRSTKNGGSNCTDCWQVRKAGVWENTTNLPNNGSNVYIQNGHTISCSGTFTCRNLNIHTGGRFDNNLGTFNLNGKLRAYTGNVVITQGADGTFYSSQASNANPPNGIFVGQVSIMNIIGFSRNITNTGEWGVSSPLIGTIVCNLTMTPGNTATFQTDFSITRLTMQTGNVNMGANTLYVAPGSLASPSLKVNAGCTFTSSNSGAAAGSCVLTRNSTQPTGPVSIAGNMILSGASPYLQATSYDLQAGSTIEYNGAAQNFANASFAGSTVLNTYRNLILSGSGNKTPVGNFNVDENITISGSAVLAMGSRTANITGNWTSWGQGGLSEGTSTVNFDSTGPQSINTTGGENFYVMRKSAAGTLTLNSNVNIVAGGNLTMQAGVIDANANTFSGSTTSAFNMSGGTIRLAKLNTTHPEFLIPSYNITGGTIELDGAGTQTLRGGRDYRNISFLNSGTKGITSAINNITGTVTLGGSVVLDVLNNTMGGTGTNLTMTGTSVYRTAGSSQVKPDAAGTYNLGSTSTIEFNNNLTGLESIRLIGASTVNYARIIVSGTSVGTESLTTGIRFQTGGSFRLKSGAVFKQMNTAGFSGTNNTAISNTNNPTIFLEPNSTVEYNGSNQTISNQTINTPAAAHYEHLILSGTGNKTAPSSTLNINGNLSLAETAVFVHNSGTVAMTGTSAQAYTAVYPGMRFYNFSNNNTTDLSINSDMGIVKELAFAANAKLNIKNGGHITLLSSNSGTANVGIIPSSATFTYTGNAKFTVERHIASGVSHAKSWQFLAVPTNGGQTVNQAWQDTATSSNQNRYSGYGTQLTSNIFPLPATFDVYTSIAPSIKTYDTTGAGSWTGIANTTTLPIYNKKGYMVFVRGDRTVTTSNAPANETILRSSGRIFHPVSNVPPVTNIGANKFESVGNPYASAIDFSNDAGVVKSANVQKVFYVWDPKLGGSYGYGAYQTFTRGIGADNNYYVSPGGGSYGPGGSVNNSIQSGQAYFVRTFGGAGSISFNENAKLNSSAPVFRGGLPNRSHKMQLRGNLYFISNGDTVLADGVLNEFSRMLSGNIDELDVVKISNSSENLAVSTLGSDLAVERRAEIMQYDTIFYKLKQLKQQPYLFEFVARNLYRPGLQGFVEDLFLGTRTALSLSDTTRIYFTVNNNPGSYAANRFRIVFRPTNSEVAETADFLQKEAGGISVFPNPVKNKTIGILFDKQPEGKYLLQLCDRSGKLIAEKMVQVTVRNSSIKFTIDHALPGHYRLLVISPKGNRSVMTVVVL